MLFCWINRVASEYVTHQRKWLYLEALVRFWKRAYYYWDSWTTGTVPYLNWKLKENTGDHLVQKWENWLKEEQRRPRIIAWKYKLDHPTGQKFRNSWKYEMVLLQSLVSLRPCKEHRRGSKTFTAVIVNESCRSWKIGSKGIWFLILFSLIKRLKWPMRFVFHRGNVRCTDWFSNRTVALTNKALPGQYRDKMFPFHCRLTPILLAQVTTWL